MATLKEPHKIFIVQLFACYHAPSEIKEMLKEEFGVEDIPSSQLARYNPHNLAGNSLSDELKEVFTATRQHFLADRESIAIAQQNFRLRELLDLYRKVKSKNNPVLAAQFLEQAAKEEGGLLRRMEKDTPTSDPNALSKPFEDACEKIYGDPEGGECSKDTGSPVSAVVQHNSGTGS